MKKRRTKGFKVLAVCLILAFICGIAILDRLNQISAIRCQINDVSHKIRTQSAHDSARYSVGAPSTPSTSPKSLIVDNGLE